MINENNKTGLVMPKQSADRDEMYAVLSVYNKHDTWIDNEILIKELKDMIGGQLESQAYTKKVQIPAYFGLIEWEDISNKQSPKRITLRGKKFFEALQENNQEMINEQIIQALEELNFGRNVHGCSSNSDIEPPKLFVKSLLFLDFLTRKEFGYLLWELDQGNYDLIDLFSYIKLNRYNNDLSYANTPTKYNDAKPITALYNWGFLQPCAEKISSQEKLKLSDNINDSILKRIAKLEVINSLKKFNEENTEEKSQYQFTSDTPLQKIFYGSPGTGKSYIVNEITKGHEERTERVTFHPEYDYHSFVGGYKPKMDGEKIRYEFVPQVFTNIYVKAWQDLTDPYFLVIEEINRGNCAEIFGDIFQLLDRDNNYEVTPSEELKEYLKDVLPNNFDKLTLPPNLHILATMNTSDQSLFPMDSAFKRRWDWEYIPINYDENYIDVNGKEQPNPSFKYIVKLSDTETFQWIDFIEKVNTIIKNNPDLGMDKCLGNYFIKPQSDNIIELKTFINKAIFYLWNDVFKDESSENSIFKEQVTYEDFFPITTNGLTQVREILELLEVKIEKKDSDKIE